MEELKDFYENHFRSDDDLKWSELDDTQKKALENTMVYWAFKRDKAMKAFTEALYKLGKELAAKLERFYR